MVSISGTGTTAYRNGPFSESVMIKIHSRLNLNFQKIYLPSNVRIKRMGPVPKNSVPSQHSRHVEQAQD